MLWRLKPSDNSKVAALTPVELFRQCAADREDRDVWSEFLKRYSGRLHQFIRGVLRHIAGPAACSADMVTLGGVQENDLFQNVIVRLVENDCAAMKRFSGSAEEELLAYLAVISRSVVMDAIRRNNAIKRKKGVDFGGPAAPSSAGNTAMNPEVEREILTRELVGMAHQYIRSNSGAASARDRLVFQLHFFEGLSLQQIAECRGINLTKGGVEKLIKRMVSRVQEMAAAGKPEATLS